MRMFIDSRVGNFAGTVFSSISRYFLLYLIVNDPKSQPGYA